MRSDNLPSGKVDARKRASQGLEVEQKKTGLEVEGVWHTITLSLSEV